MSKLYKEEKEISISMNNKGFLVDIIHKVNGEYVHDSTEIHYSIEDVLKETLKFYTIGFNINSELDVKDKLQSGKIGENDKNCIKKMIKNLRDMSDFLEKSIEEQEDKKEGNL